MSRVNAPACLACVAVLVLCAGCAHPAAWIAEPHLAVPAGLLGPEEVTGYDTNGDSRIDYLQLHDVNGVKRQFLFDTDHDGRFDETVDLDRLRDGECRTLVVLLDGISFELIEQLYAEGHFRLFYQPGRVIPGWPTVTDNIYADFFETPRPFGVEALYADRDTGKMAGGYGFYLKGGNERVWPGRMLWRQGYLYDAIVYGLPDWVAGRELDKTIGAAIRWLETSDDPYAAIYLVSTDALGHKLGHEKLKAFLLRVDEAIEQLVWRARGRLRVVTLADHALNEAPMKRVAVPKALRRAGFRVTESLQSDRDVLVPDFGLVSHVAITTRCPADVAAVCAEVEGVDLAVYPDEGAFVVVSRDGLARVEVDAKGRYRYVVSRGDPLRLQVVVGRLREAGKVDDAGWADRDVWLEATWDHDYPDPLVRIAGAFAGNVVHPPDVLLSLGPEYFFGEDEFDAFATLRGTHGSLHRCATTTYVLTNFLPPPPYQRATGLRDALKRRLGLPTLLPSER